jgi:hypothetical protein
MATLVIDTLQFANRLKTSGMPDKQAEATVEFIAEIIEDNIATKKDLHLVKNDLETSLVKVKADLELKIAELKTEIIKWVLGISLAQAAIIISCIKLIHS